MNAFETTLAPVGNASLLPLLYELNSFLKTVDGFITISKNGGLWLAVVNLDEIEISYDMTDAQLLEISNNPKAFINKISHDLGNNND